MAIVDELITVLGFETATGSDSQAEKQKKNLDEIKGAAKSAGLALIGATVAIGAWAKSTASGLDNQVKFARSLDQDVEQLQELGHAVKISGGDVGEFNSDISNLVQQFGGLKTATQIVDDLAAQTEGMSNLQISNLAKQFGLSQSTILLLQQGKDGIAKLRKESRDLGLIIPKESFKASEDFNDNLARLTGTTSFLSAIISSELLPTFSGWIDAIRKILISNKDIIKTVAVVAGKFIVIGGAIAAAAGSIIGFIGGAKIMLILLKGAATLIGVTGAAVIALGLLLDDLFSFATGGDSFLAPFLQPAVDMLADIFMWIDKVITAGKKLADFAGSGVADFAEGVVGFLGGGTSAPVSNVNSSSANQSTSNTFNIQSTDPASVAAEVVRRQGQTQQILTPGLSAPVVG